MDKDSLKQILADLVAFVSITPDDADCQDYMLDFLKSINFRTQKFTNPPVANFYAEFGGDGPLLLFAGHTDVVPAGDLAKWNTNPFDLSEKDGVLYGRGVADMKGSLASMLIAAARYVNKYPNSVGRLGFLITSGEEGDDFLNGTPYVISKLQEQGIKPDYCIVGEPSSNEVIGDVIKIGRRGSLTGKVELQGIQGHVAYPHLAKNPIHILAPVLDELTKMVWNDADEYFPQTSLQVTYLHSGGIASNIIPGELKLQFNCRYSIKQTAKTLQQDIYNCFKKHGVKIDIEWILNGDPFLTQGGRLLSTTVEVIKKHTNLAPQLSTSGGTSDGRFIAPLGVELIELGPVNKSIHQINENVLLDDLVVLSELYFLICEEILR